VLSKCGKGIPTSSRKGRGASGENHADYEQAPGVGCFHFEKGHTSGACCKNDLRDGNVCQDRLRSNSLSKGDRPRYERAGEACRGNAVMAGAARGRKDEGEKLSAAVGKEGKEAYIKGALPLKRSKPLNSR